MPSTKYEWVFLQSVTNITDAITKKIKRGLLKLEVSKLEVWDKHGNITSEARYLLYEPVLVST
jgi:hypothetical protein